MYTKKIALFFIIGFIYLLTPQASHAEVLFEDNFNQYPSGSFPSKWSIFNSTCNPNWRVENGVLKISIGSGCGTHLIPSSSEWPNMVDDYILDLDIRFISGIDRHISYRLNPTLPFVRVLHFIIPTGFALDTDNQNYLVNTLKSYQNNVTYHFKILVTSERITIYESNGVTDDLELTRDVFFTNPLPPGMIGLGSSPGGGGLTETWFDNVKVTTIDHEDGLDVPLLKQTDPLWADDIYDSSTQWQSNNGATIGQVGCAITSAAMVFQYHGLKKMPDGITEVTPKSLNDYLTGIADANFRNGDTNWESMSKHLSPLLAVANNAQFNSLEYRFQKHQENSILDEDLANGLPAILRVPGHFIVAKGKDSQNNSYFINDPLYDRNSLLDYDNLYQKSITYIPSNSDLSYLIFAVDPDVEMALYDDQGNLLESATVDFPIDDPLQLSTNLVGPLKFIQYAKPSGGNYFLKINSSTSNNYLLDGYIYDEGDGAKMFSRNGVVGNSNEDTYEISFNKLSADNSSVLNPVVSFQTILTDITDLYIAGHIIKKGSYNYLTNKIEQAQRYEFANPERSKSLLENIRQQLIDDKRRGIDVFASQFLIDQITVLLEV